MRSVPDWREGGWGEGESCTRRLGPGEGVADRKEVPFLDLKLLWMVYGGRYVYNVYN